MGKGRSFSHSYATPVVTDSDDLEEVFQHYNPDNLPSTQLIVNFLPERLSKLVPNEFSIRERNFHIFFFLWYEQQNRLPASLPKIAQEYTNFYSLYRIVTLKMGGFMKISHSKDGEWAAIWKNSPNYSSNATSSASSRVKSTYSRFLFPFENVFHQKCKMFTWKLYRRCDSNALQEKINSDTISKNDKSKDGDSLDNLSSPIDLNNVNGFIMETAFKLFENKLSQIITNVEHEVFVDPNFIYFSIDTEVKINKEKKKKLKKKSESSDDDSETEKVTEEDDKPIENAKLIDPVPKNKNHVGDILYSLNNKMIRLVISNDAPIEDDYIVVGRLTPSSDYTKDDIFSYLSRLDINQLVKNSNRKIQSKKDLDLDLLLSIKFLEVSMEQHSRPQKENIKRKRKSPKKIKKSKRQKIKDGKEKISTEPILTEEYEEYESLPPTRPTRNLQKEKERDDVSEYSEGSGIDEEVMTDIRNETQTILPGIFFIRYKFNNDTDDDYRVIHVPIIEIANGKLNLQKLNGFMERDNVSMDGVFEIRYLAQTVTNDILGWVRITDSWNHKLDVPLKQSLSLWLLTKKGYQERYKISISNQINQTQTQTQNQTQSNQIQTQTQSNQTQMNPIQSNSTQTNQTNHMSQPNHLNQVLSSISSIPSNQTNQVI